MCDDVEACQNVSLWWAFCLFAAKTQIGPNSNCLPAKFSASVDNQKVKGRGGWGAASDNNGCKVLISRIISQLWKSSVKCIFAKQLLCAYIWTAIQTQEKYFKIRGIQKGRGEVKSTEYRLVNTKVPPNQLNLWRLRPWMSVKCLVRPLSVCQVSGETPECLSSVWSTWIILLHPIHHPCPH